MRDFFAKDEVAKYLGAELVQFHPGYAEVRMQIRKTHLNAHGTVHGGVIFAIADLAFGIAGNSEGIPSVAIDATISYMKTVRQGSLIAKAEEFVSNPRLGSYRVEVTTDDGERIALFQGMSYRRSTPSDGRTSNFIRK